MQCIYTLLGTLCLWSFWDCLFSYTLQDDAPTAKDPVPKVLLISFDGFRHDYIEKYNLIKFKRFAALGARAMKVQSCFTTVTFPNHFSLVTGLYEDVHGVISNEMFDSSTNKSFDIHTPESECQWWQQNPYAIPLWILNQKTSPSSSRRSSGTVCWVSSGCEFSGIRPDRRIPCQDVKTHKHTIDTVFSWFSNSTKDPVNFAAVYFDEPDKTGHEHGPDSSQMNLTLHNLELILDQIEQSIQENNLTSLLDVVLVSDHGMTSVDPGRSVVLSDYIDCEYFKSYGTTTVKTIFTKSQEAAEEIFRNLSTLGDKIKVYATSQLKDFHYSNNTRLGQLTVVAEPGYMMFKSWVGRNRSTLKGNHGYFNFIDDMNTIFLAKGPSFRPNSTIDSMRIVDVFPLMIELLKLDKLISAEVSRLNQFEPGSLSVTIPLLSYAPKDHGQQIRASTMYFVLFSMGLIVSIGVLTTFCIIRAALRVILLPNGSNNNNNADNPNTSEEEDGNDEEKLTNEIVNDDNSSRELV